MIRHFLRWADKRVGKKSDAAKSTMDSGKMVTAKTQKEIDVLVGQVPGTNMSESDVLCDEECVYGTISYQKNGIKSCNNLPYAGVSDEYGLYQFSYSCHLSLDLPCVHIIEFSQRFAAGSYNVESIPRPVQFVDGHRWARRLPEQN